MYELIGDSIYELVGDFMYKMVWEFIYELTYDSIYVNWYMIPYIWNVKLTKIIGLSYDLKHYDYLIQDSPNVITKLYFE